MMNNVTIRRLCMEARDHVEITCSPSCADYRQKTNAVILLDMGHTLRGEHIQEE
jgi:hypothetical protein